MTRKDVAAAGRSWTAAFILFFATPINVTGDSSVFNPATNSSWSFESPPFEYGLSWFNRTGKLRRVDTACTLPGDMNGEIAVQYDFQGDGCTMEDKIVNCASNSGCRGIIVNSGRLGLTGYQMYSFLDYKKHDMIKLKSVPMVQVGRADMDRILSEVDTASAAGSRVLATLQPSDNKSKQARRDASISSTYTALSAWSALNIVWAAISLYRWIQIRGKANFSILAVAVLGTEIAVNAISVFYFLYDPGFSRARLSSLAQMMLLIFMLAMQQLVDTTMAWYFFTSASKISGGRAGCKCGRRQKWWLVSTMILFEGIIPFTLVVLYCVNKVNSIWLQATLLTWMIVSMLVALFLWSSGYQLFSEFRRRDTTDRRVAQRSNSERRGSISEIERLTKRRSAASRLWWRLMTYTCAMIVTGAWGFLLLRPEFKAGSGYTLIIYMVRLMILCTISIWCFHKDPRQSHHAASSAPVSVPMLSIVNSLGKDVQRRGSTTNATTPSTDRGTGSDRTHAMTPSTDRGTRTDRTHAGDFKISMNSRPASATSSGNFVQT